MAVQIGGINARITKDWLPFRVLYQDNADRQAGLTLANTVTDGPARAVSQLPYSAAVPLEDGRIIFAPKRASTIDRIEANGTFVTGQAINETGPQRCSGAVLLPNGLILFIPERADNFVLYDPIADVIVAKYPVGVAAPSFASQSRFYGATLAKDGKVYALNHPSRQMFCFDPEARTLSAVGGLCPVDVNETTIPFYGHILAPDGRIVMIARSNSVSMTFNPETLAYIPTASDGTGSSYLTATPFPGPDGRIYCPRSSATSDRRPRAYDPMTDTWEALPDPTTHSNAFAGGTPLPGDRVAFFPLTAQRPAIYHIPTRTWAQGGEVADAVGANFNGGALLRDGRVLLLPDTALNARFWTPFSGGTYLPWHYIASRYIGNRG